MQLRRATVADAAKVGAHFRACFIATFGHLYRPEDLQSFLDECSDARFAEELAGPDHACMLAEADGALVGHCTLGPQALPVESDARWWVLRQLYLAEAAKGTGLARQLMDWALGEARARGYAELYLTVYVENRRARRLYERYGFAEVGKYAFAVGEHMDDDRIMKLCL